MFTWLMYNCRAQQSGARLGNRDVAPGGDITQWYLVAALQSRPRERQMYVTVLAPRGPDKFGTRDLHLTLPKESHALVFHAGHSTAAVQRLRYCSLSHSVYPTQYIKINSGNAKKVK